VIYYRVTLRNATNAMLYDIFACCFCLRTNLAKSISASALIHDCRAL